MSDESDEDFCTYGKPLEPLDDDYVPKKKAQTLADQVARDPEGRRRFHGAFTGGFSAGFMNTAGSLEGWTPTQFKSSRSERGVFKTQCAEDLMDEEDRGEFGIAPNRLLARPDFATASPERKRDRVIHSEGPIPGIPVLHDILQPVRETIGVRLLKEMGWKPGQGVGPRVTRREKKMYGCALPPGVGQESDNSDSDSEFTDVKFAPDDIHPYIVAAKKDTFGLGYTGLDRHSVLGARNVSSELRFTEKNHKVRIGGQAFGVGALEDDDEDIYAREDMSQYDFTLGDSEEKQTRKALVSVDGVLEGFVASEKKVMSKPFPLPPLPKGFQPKHVEKKSRFDKPKDDHTSEIMKPLGLGRHELNSSSRAVLIGETSNSEGFKVETTPTVASSSEKPPRFEPSNTFKPFQSDEDKQTRYDKYLNLKDKGELAGLQPLHMNQWEKERERSEFEQAARIFSPLTGIMNDRFTRASQPDDLNNPLAVVEKVKHGNETQRNAAKMKMYGSLTREQIEWRPCSLLCKRFNVPEPDVVGETILVPKKGSKYSIFDSLEALVAKEEPASIPSTSAPSINNKEEFKTAPSSDVTSQLTEETPLFADSVTKVDLFKAIFLDSSDDEEAEPEIKKEVTYDDPVNNVERNTSPARGLFADVDLDSLAKREKDLPPPTPVILHPIAGNSDKEPTDNGDDYYGPKLPDRLSSSSFKTTTQASMTTYHSAATSDDCVQKDEKKYMRRRKNKMKLNTCPTSSASSSDDWVEKEEKRKHKKHKKNKKHKSKHKRKK